jgi:hypothetical protein
MNSKVQVLKKKQIYLCCYQEKFQDTPRGTIYGQIFNNTEVFLGKFLYTEDQYRTHEQFIRVTSLKAEKNTF